MIDNADNTLSPVLRVAVSPGGEGGVINWYAPQPHTYSRRVVGREYPHAAARLLDEYQLVIYIAARP